MNNKLFALLGLATLGFTYFSLQLLFAVYPPKPIGIRLNGHVDTDNLLEEALEEAREDNDKCIEVIERNKAAYEDYQRSTATANQRVDEYLRAVEQRDERIVLLNEIIERQQQHIQRLANASRATGTPESLTTEE